MYKSLLTNEESFTHWLNIYVVRGTMCDAEKHPPEQFPCVIAWYEYEVHSMKYGWAIECEYIYPADFEE